MDQAAAKRILQELIKNEELGNKKCIDCGNPNPQWATVRSDHVQSVPEHKTELLCLALLYSYVYNVPACIEDLVYTLGEYAFLYRGSVDAMRLTTPEASYDPCQWTLGKKSKSNVCR